jgi:hypothetical protein
VSAIFSYSNTKLLNSCKEELKVMFLEIRAFLIPFNHGGRKQKHYNFFLLTELKALSFPCTIVLENISCVEHLTKHPVKNQKHFSAFVFA